MRVIFSRKGFDSSAGGHPSPEIDGQLISLPIPTSDVREGEPYSEIPTRLGMSAAEVMTNLGIHTVRVGDHEVPVEAAYGHFDPQVSPADGHRGALGHSRQVAVLSKHGVTIGDVFLFFGWFRPAEMKAGALRWKTPRSDFHALWGYLQVGEIINIGADRHARSEFASHPHVRRVLSGEDRGDHLYAASPHLTLLENRARPGSGHLSYSPLTRLTDPLDRDRSDWRLPSCFDPEETRISGFPRSVGTSGRPRFRRQGEYVYVRSAGRGQEFIAHADGRVIEWLRGVLDSS